ncbi:hypothetical protein ZIOFF_065149 [Zingiber officinale]|uniref:Uncharacterized protein n=1 Tax=Zingiber officinale TaxID=94328 RepID=A0A8J5K703_ZINOF|nr:hypothetical protein ZIOFF_065149 [Zingiber officinale]
MNGSTHIAKDLGIARLLEQLNLLLHVLSLEGGRGLTIHEVASKIQKSGLRYLTTSKTPKGSVAAALSCDTQLFEKIAPSTYCVQSRYRKDPADADAVLSAALTKVQEDVDDAERDEDTEDADDDPEVDDASMDPTLGKNELFGSKLKDPRMYTSLGKGKGGDTEDTLLITFGNVEKVPPIPCSDNLKTVGISGAAEHTDASLKYHESANPDMEDTEINESNFGEPWVQGLSEGDYWELSVQERLNALVSLIGIAIDGNSIRAVLEERIEAATALKKCGQKHN